MARTLTVAVLVAALLLGAAAGLLWWTATPGGRGAELAAALAVAGEGDGRLAVAQPRRTARWLARHRHALILLTLAAPAARGALPRLEPLLLPLVAAARGPLVTWWRGPDLAMAAAIRPGAGEAITLLAARHGLACRFDGGVGRIATAPALLAGGSAAPTLPDDLPELAALAEVRGCLWTVRAERSRLTAASSASVAVPERGDGSWVETRDAAALLGPLGVPVPLPAATARLRFAVARGWGVAATGVELPGFLSTALPTSGSGAVRWDGLLGEVLVLATEDGLAVATSAELLAAVAGGAAGEEGSVRAVDLAWLAGELATSLERLPLLDREARALRETATASEGLEDIRWRAGDGGARILIEW